MAVRKDLGRAHFTWPTAVPSPVPLRTLLRRDGCQPGLPPESLKRGVARRKVVEAVQNLAAPQRATCNVALRNVLSQRARNVQNGRYIRPKGPSDPA